MSTARDRDLERWEQGGLSMSELVALHGRDGAAGLVALHRRMSALGTGPVGDPETVWRAIRERLPDLALPRRTTPLRRRLTRPLAIAAATVLIAGTAYAGSPDAVQRYLTSFWHTVRSMLDVDVAGNAPADVNRPSQGGGQGRPAGAVDDAEREDPDDDDANDDGDQPGETSEGDGGADGAEAEDGDEDGSDDDDEGTGDDEGDEPEDDAEGDEPDEPQDDDEPEEDDELDDDDEPGDDDEDD